MHGQQQISPQVAGRLVELAREMRVLVYGEEAFPEWGTRFTEIEDKGMDLGLELARLFIEQSVDQQAQHVPESSLEIEGEVAAPAGSKDVKVDTPAGKVGWRQPRTRLDKAERDFFPSGEGFGRRH